MPKTNRTTVVVQREKLHPPALPAGLKAEISRSRKADIDLAERTAAQCGGADALGKMVPESNPLPSVYELLEVIGALVVDNAHRLAPVYDALLPQEMYACMGAPDDAPHERVVAEQLGRVIEVLRWTERRIEEMQEALYGGSAAGLRTADQFATSR